MEETRSLPACRGLFRAHGRSKLSKRPTEDSSSNENFCFLLLLFVFKIVYAKSLNNQKHHFDDKAGEICFTIQGKCMREHEV